MDAEFEKLVAAEKAAREAYDAAYAEFDRIVPRIEALHADLRDAEQAVDEWVADAASRPGLPSRRFPARVIA